MVTLDKRERRWIMALHGNIQIQRDKIGYYSIRRKGPIREDGPNEYYWEVHINDTGCGGNILHNYSDGAIVLLSKVFQEAEKIMEKGWAGFLTLPEDFTN